MPRSTRSIGAPRSKHLRAPGDPIPADGSRDRGRLRHRADIQGLRAVAVLLVVLGHAGVGFLRGGFIGVDVFFVLSGFLITGLRLAEAADKGSVSLRRFYARRAKRILPAAALTLAVTAIAANLLLNFVRAKQAVLDGIWAAFFAANVHFARQGIDYFAEGQPPSPVQHYWTLAVEEQFYLVWPLALSLALVGVAVRRHRRRADGPAERAAAPHLRTRRLAVVILLAGLASLAWSIYATDRTPISAYFSFTARAWELALGAALAIGASRFLQVSDRTRALMGWVGLLAIGAAAVLFSETTPFPGYAALLPTVGTAMVIAAGIGNERPRWGVGGLLARAPLPYIGDRSYAFYLWHWPVLIVAAAYLGRDLSVGANLSLLAGAFLLSMLSYGLIENPIRRTPLRRPIRAAAVVWGTSVGLVLVVAALTLQLISIESARLAGAVPAGPLPTVQTPSPPPGTNGTPSTPSAGSLPAVVAAVEGARQGAPLPAGLIPPLDRLLDDLYQFPRESCYAQRGMDQNPEVCRLGATESDRTIVVFGDSHARQWMPAIVWAAERDGWTVVPLIQLGCRPSHYGSVCASYYDWALRQVETLRPEAVLISGILKVDSPENQRGSVAGISRLVGDVRPFAENVVVIGDPPAQGLQPVDCLLARDATLATCTHTLTSDQVSVYRDVERAAGAGGAAFVDTLGWFCFERQCPMVAGRTISYRDRGHITQTYVLELREVFRTELRRAVSG